MIAAVNLPEWFGNILFPVSRWLHIVSITLLVGGTLFYELVVPIAIEDLKPEQQLSVFGRARWVFRWLVWISAVLLPLTGALSMWRMWYSYVEGRPMGVPLSYPWVMAHVILGSVGILIAMLLTVGGRPPKRPVMWMRVNLVILLVVVFLANVTRHTRLTEREQDLQRLHRLEDSSLPLPHPTTEP